MAVQQRGQEPVISARGATPALKRRAPITYDRLYKDARQHSRLLKKRLGVLRDPHTSTSSAERKIINDFKSSPFVLSYVEGLRKGFSAVC